MKPLVVVHIISALPVGGVERNLLRVLPRLNRERFRVSVVCIREKGDLASAMEEAGVPVHLVCFASRYDPPSLWRLRKFLRSEEADIVHCHMRRANTSGRIAALLAGVPVRIASERDMGVDKTRRHYFIDRFLARWTDVIMTVTTAVADHEAALSGIPREKFRTLYNGYELERFRDLSPREEARASFNLPPDAKVVGCIGRLHEIKNVDAVVRAFSDPALADTRLLLVGDGEERQALESLVNELGLSERVIFAGFQDDLLAVYAALDASVLASRSEGIANVQLESMAAGVPLVTTPVGIAAEAFRAGEQYIEVASADPVFLAKGIAEALDPARAASLSETARQDLSRFSIEEQTRQFESMYTECARARGVLDGEESR